MSHRILAPLGGRTCGGQCDRHLAALVRFCRQRCGFFGVGSRVGKSEALILRQQVLLLVELLSLLRIESGAFRCGDLLLATHEMLIQRRQRRMDQMHKLRVHARCVREITRCQTGAR
jgi:hypothetical protein